MHMHMYRYKSHATRIEADAHGCLRPRKALCLQGPGKHTGTAHAPDLFGKWYRYSLNLRLVTRLMLQDLILNIARACDVKYYSSTSLHATRRQSDLYNLASLPQQPRERKAEHPAHGDANHQPRDGTSHQRAVVRCDAIMLIIDCKYRWW